MERGPVKTTISPDHLLTPGGQQAQQIIQNCVHCGFCNATCPTYQILGDELDGPRGRIYLIKNFLENNTGADTLMRHLDRCLTCRNCETTCPSGVEYSQLLETARNLADKQARRPALFRLKRSLVKILLSSPRLFSRLVRLGRMFRFLLPRGKRELLTRARAGLPPLLSAPSLNPKQNPKPDPKLPTLYLLKGCVQPALAPQINAVTQYLLQQLGYKIKSLEGEQCCGAIHLHNADQRRAVHKMSANMEAWQRDPEHRHSFIISTASGCAVTLKEYHKTFQHSNDEGKTDLAAYFSQQVRDLTEVLYSHKNLAHFIPASVKKLKIAVHMPCTLQHGMRLRPLFEKLLGSLQLQLLPVRDSHLCCGSAGTYSLFQKKLSRQLLLQKTACLNDAGPDLVITANIGCLLELRQHSQVPVVHWVELFNPGFTLSQL